MKFVVNLIGCFGAGIVVPYGSNFLLDGCQGDVGRQGDGQLFGFRVPAGCGCAGFFGSLLDARLTHAAITGNSKRGGLLGGQVQGENDGEESENIFHEFGI